MPNLPTETKPLRKSAEPEPETPVAETTESGTGGTPMNPPQPGADADGFGGDAPAMAAEEPTEAKVTPIKSTVAKAAKATASVAHPSGASAPKAMVGGLGATLADQTTWVSLLLYGPEGTSKTTSALRMANLCEPGQRVLMIDAEAGAKIKALQRQGVDVSKIEIWPRPEDGGPSALTYEGMAALADELERPGMTGKDGTYIGGVWDSGSEITRRLLDQVTSTARDKDARLGKDRGRFQVNLEDHGIASSMLRDLLRRFRDLPWHFVVTALERRDIDQDTGQVKYGPAMSPAMANDCAGLVDLVGYTLVDQVGPEAVDIFSARFTPLQRRRAKDRFGVLPSKMADPFFDRIVAYVNGDLTKDQDPVQQNVRDLARAATEAAGTATPANQKKEG